MRKIITPALAAILAIAAVPASAEVPTVQVRYSDLDLTSPAGVATLQGRIDGALDKVCGPPEFRDLRAGQLREQCLRTAERSVTEQVAQIARERGLAMATMLPELARG